MKTKKRSTIGKSELFESMINTLAEFQVITEFENDDVVINVKETGLSKVYGFEYAIFHSKKWYKVITSEVDSKIELFEQNDDVQEITKEILKKDSEFNGVSYLIQLAQKFITETEKIKLTGKFKNKSIWIGETPFGKIFAFVSNDEIFHLQAIELDSEIHFDCNYYGTENDDFKLYCKMTQRYYNAFERDDSSKFSAIGTNGKKIKF
jgi:hypothetical protein